MITGVERSSARTARGKRKEGVEREAMRDLER
jgi:hypothetical protein